MPEVLHKHEYIKRYVSFNLSKSDRDIALL